MAHNSKKAKSEMNKALSASKISKRDEWFSQSYTLMSSSLQTKPNNSQTSSSKTSKVEEERFLFDEELELENELQSPSNPSTTTSESSDEVNQDSKKDSEEEKEDDIEEDAAHSSNKNNGDDDDDIGDQLSSFSFNPAIKSGTYNPLFIKHDSKPSGHSGKPKSKSEDGAISFALAKKKVVDNREKRSQSAPATAAAIPIPTPRNSRR